MNPLLLIDGYKLDHRRQYPPGTQKIYSNFTARGSRVEGQTEVCFIGLQYCLQRYLMQELRPFFETRFPDRFIEQYARRVNGYLGPNTVGTEHIRRLWEVGYLPLEFKAFPEGSRVPLRTPIFTVENTDPDFFWLVNYYETLLSSVLWMPITSATTAMRMRRLLDVAAQTTGTDPAFVDWQGHDFSFRGMPGIEAAQLSGMGHLVFFSGTDTIPALDLIEEYYTVGSDEPSAGGSVPATEHSVMCAAGQTSERATILRLLDLYPAGILSVVSDTWDLWKVLTEILPDPEVKARILARQGKYVTRPDSGSPILILCGDPAAPADSPARKGVIELLWDVFGGTVTSTGHRLLDAHVGAIYGDSISYERAQAIIEGLAAKGFASGNVVFGLGSFTYQFTTRDTYNFAMKATWALIDGQPVDMFKAPVTDDGMKFSATGRLAVHRTPTGYQTFERATASQELASVLRPVWRNGQFLAYDSFRAIRQRARA